MSRSAATIFSIPGRRTLSAIVRPSWSLARWTCEIEAEASGSWLDPGEDLGGRPAELLEEDRLDLGERERLDVVAELGELGGVGLGQEVRPGAEDLAELDEGRPEVLADQPKSLGPGMRRGLVAQGRALDRADDLVEVERGDDVAISEADQARQDLAVAGQVAEVADGFADQADSALGSIGFGFGTGSRARSRPRPKRA